MDGVDPEHNIQDNLSDVWSELSYVEELADNFINGVPSAAHAFVRAGGSVSALFFKCLASPDVRPPCPDVRPARSLVLQRPHLCSHYI